MLKRLIPVILFAVAIAIAANAPVLNSNALRPGPAKGTPEAMMAAKKAINTNYGIIKPMAPRHQATDATITCYPTAANYSTGSTLTGSKTQVSLAMAGNPSVLTTDRGWMGFDISGIPAGSVINSVTLYAYCYQAGSYSYWALTRITHTDPRTSSASDVYGDINYGDVDGYYLIFYNNPTVGWNSWLLGATAVTDLTNALGGGYYAVGVHDWDEYPSYYYVDFQGWAETNVPYIIVDYTPPSASDVGVRRIVSPPSGLIPGGSTTVSAMVQNYGTAASGTFPVKMDIGAYTNTQTAPSMVSGDSELITFTSWTATGGVYTAKCSTQLTGDGNNLNDFKSISVSVYDFIQDFEADNGGYVAQPVDGWQWGTPTIGPMGAHSGVNCWAAGLNTVYPSPATWYLTTHAMQASMDNPTIMYYDWWYTEGYWDGYNVSYSIDDGLTWTLIYPNEGYNYSYVVGLNGQPGFSGTQTSWLTKSFTVPVLNTQVFKIRFFFGADPSISYTGAYIDDFSGIGCTLFNPTTDIGAVKSIIPTGMWAPGEPCTPSILITNYASASQSNFNVRMVVTPTAGGSAVYDQTVLFTGTIAQGETTQVDFPEWTNPGAGTYYDSMMTQLVGDQNPLNDAKVIALDVSDGGSGWLAYCDSTTEVGYCWTSPGGEWATKFHSGGGMLLRALRMNCTDYSGSSAWYDAEMRVYEADGPGGAPGTMVFDTAVQVFSEGYPGGHWNEFDIQAFGVTVTGDFFLSYYQTETWPPFMGMDQNAPLDGDDWGYIPGSGWDDAEGGLDASYDNQLEVGYTIYSKDAGVLSINIPPTQLDSGVVVTPRATVGNLGFLPRTFDVAMSITNGGTVSYADTLPGLSWMPFQIQTLDFTKTWTADPIPGSWTVKAYTDLSPDFNPTNDTATEMCFVKFLDSRTDSILRPNTSEAPGAVPVIIRGRNIGNTQLDSMKIRGIITTPAGDTVYDENRVYYNVAPGTAITSTMGAAWYPSGGGVYYAHGVTTTLNDMYAVDDEKVKPVYLGEVDAELMAIIQPTTQHDTMPFAPSVKVRNNSTVAMDIPVEVKIYNNTTGLLAYTATGTAAGVLANGGTADVVLDTWPIVGADTGSYVDTARVTAADPTPGNDVKVRNFSIKVNPVGAEYGPWTAMAPVISAPSGKNPKAGSAAAFFEGSVYFLKAGGKGDFAKWTPDTLVDGPGTWTADSIPKGIKPTNGKYPKKGASMVAYTDGLFVLRGNNTPGFWKYVVAPPPETSGWVEKAPIPTGAKNPKDASNMVVVNISGADYIFTMKGSKTPEFYLYDIANNLWGPAINAPTGLSGKTGYKKGSCMAYDPGTNDVYILQGQYGSFFKYNLDAQTWTELKRYDHKTYLNRDGKKKKFGDGAAMVNLGGVLYAMKGGNTLEMWKYDLTSDTQDWKLPDAAWDIPAGSKKVKGGGTFILGGVNLYATRGANTPDFFMKAPLAYAASTPAPVAFNGTMANPVTTHEFKLTLAPNPAINLTALRYTLPKAGSVRFTLYNVAGTAVRTYTNSSLTTNGVLMLDTKALPSGVYILRFNSGAISATRKLVLEK
jgi:Secretion system C-terminal sorting domain/CARDB